MELMQVIKDRRSVRKYKPDPVSDDLVKAVLEAGRWAPSWANSQCWRFVVVRDAQIRAKIAETIDSLNPPKEAVRPTNPAIDAIKNVSVIIVICGELGRAGYKKGEPRTDKGDSYMFDAALATQNMMLAAHSLGLGTVPIGVFDAPKVAEILHVPSNTSVVLLLPLGYPAEEPTAPRRKGLTEITFYY